MHEERFLDMKKRLKDNLNDFEFIYGKALEYMDKSLVAQAALGEHIFKEFMTSKKKEWDSFRTYVSKWELDKYLERY